MQNGLVLAQAALTLMASLGLEVKTAFLLNVSRRVEGPPFNLKIMDPESKFGSHETLQLPSGKLVKMSDVAFVNHLVKLKETNGSDFWPVIDVILKWWQGKNPTEWKSYLLELQNVRETRADEKYGESVGKTGRYMLDVPQSVMLVIRKLYSVDELPMNKKFWLTFGRKYPAFKVAQKL